MSNEQITSAEAMNILTGRICKLEAALQRANEVIEKAESALKMKSTNGAKKRLESEAIAAIAAYRAGDGGG